jgi:hypothetical protein
VAAQQHLRKGMNSSALEAGALPEIRAHAPTWMESSPGPRSDFRTERWRACTTRSSRFVTAHSDSAAPTTSSQPSIPAAPDCRCLPNTNYTFRIASKIMGVGHSIAFGAGKDQRPNHNENRWDGEEPVRTVALSTRESPNLCGSVRTRTYDPLVMPSGCVANNVFSPPPVRFTLLNSM